MSDEQTLSEIRRRQAEGAYAQSGPYGVFVAQDVQFLLDRLDFLERSDALVIRWRETGTRLDEATELIRRLVMDYGPECKPDCACSANTARRFLAGEEVRL